MSVHLRDHSPSWIAPLVAHTTATAKRALALIQRIAAATRLAFAALIAYVKQSCFPAPARVSYAAPLGLQIIQGHFTKAEIAAFQSLPTRFEQHLPLAEWSREDLSTFIQMTVKISEVLCTPLRYMAEDGVVRGGLWKDLMQDCPLTEVQMLLNIYRTYATQFDSIQAERENQESRRRPITTTFAFEKMAPLPLGNLLAKTQKLLQLQAEGRLGQATPDDKLTLTEFYFVKRGLPLLRPFFTTACQTLTDFQQLFCMYYSEDCPKICVLNWKKVVGVQAAFGQHVYLTKLMAAGPLCRYNHTNIFGYNSANGQYYVSGIGQNGRYVQTCAPNLLPAMEILDIDVAQLGRALPKAKQELFPAQFSTRFDALAFDCNKNIRMLTPEREMLKRIGRLRRPSHAVKPAAITVTSDTATAMLCSEFVAKCIIQATCQAYIALGEPPPPSFAHFGWPHAAALEASLPAHFLAKLTRSAILKPSKQLDCFLRYT